MVRVQRRRRHLQVLPVRSLRTLAFVSPSGFIARFGASSGPAEACPLAHAHPLKPAWITFGALGDTST